jgi:hypothetical protein
MTLTPRPKVIRNREAPTSFLANFTATVTMGSGLTSRKAASDELLRLL